MSLNISHINVCSLLPKFQEFEGNVIDVGYDVVGVTESWLHAGIPDEAVEITGYKLLRQDRPTRAGGICIYIKKGIKFQFLFGGNHESCEYMFIKIILSKFTFVFGVLYRPSSNTDYNTFFSHFEDVMSNLYLACENLLCMGDFNIDLINISSNTVKNFISLTETFNFRQLVT